MQPEAFIINRPDVDFSTFLGVALKTLGHSPGAASDSSHRQFSVATRYLSCLATLRCGKAGSELNLSLLPHVSISVLIVADDVDVYDILEGAAGMPFVTAPTTVRGVMAAVLTGNLAQWKASVIAGSSNEVEAPVRFTFNRIHGLFCDETINLWTDCQQKPASDNITYLLEDKRGR